MEDTKKNSFLATNYNKKRSIFLAYQNTKMKDQEL